MSRRRPVVLVAALALLLLPLRAAVAQGAIKNRMTLSATTITFPTPTETDYDNGSVAASTPKAQQR